MQLMLKHKNKTRTRTGGFTLIEMALVIMIIGIGVAAFAPLYGLYIKEQRLQTTRNNIEAITSALGSYRSVHGRYPLPAPVVARANAGYGHESGAAPLPPGLPPAPGVGPGGLDPALRVFISQGQRNLPNYLNPYVAGNPTINNLPPPVRTGFVPFRILGLDESVSYDGHGNHIMYALTEHLGFDVTYRPSEGGIDILDPLNQTVVNPPGAADYVVFSMGENENGAFTASGAQFPCAAGRDTMNCSFPKAQARFRQSEQNTTTAANQFDDVLSYFIQTEVPLWQISATPGFENSIHNKPAGDVGFAFNPLSFPVGVQSQVLGDVLAQDDPATDDNDPLTTTDIEGYVLGKQLCSSGNNCFNIDLITGSLANPTGGMECPADDLDGVGTYMVGIMNGRPICENDITSGCYTARMVLAGFDPLNNNAPVCRPVGPQAGCPQTNVTLCSGTPSQASVVIPTVASGTIARAPAAGYIGHSRAEDWQCNNGSWSRVNATGVCICTPSQNRVINCVPGFNGGLNQICTMDCSTIPPTPLGCTPTPPPANSNPIIYPPGSGCTCTNQYQRNNLYCPPGHSPPNPNVQPYEDRTFTCSNPTSGSWSPWVQHNWPCTCGATTTQVVTCPTPLIGSYTQTNTYNCNTMQWNGWTPATPPVGACTCVPSVTTRTGPCPVGQVGSITYQDTVNCPAATVTTITTSNTCGPPPPVSCTIKSNGAPTLSSTPTPNVIGTSCTCGSASVASCHAGSAPNYNKYFGCPCSP